MADDLMGVHEIAEYLGVSRQRVDEIVRTKMDFPPAAAELKAGRIWNRADIEAWARATRRVEEVPETTADGKLDPLVWTSTEAARLLRVSRTTVLEMVRRGELPAIRIGTRVKIPKVALAEYLARSRQS